MRLIGRWKHGDYEQIIDGLLPRSLARSPLGYRL